MNRKDTIIIAVLLNVAVLAVLFVTAIHSGDEQANDSGDIGGTITSSAVVPTTSQPIAIASREASNEYKFDLLMEDLDVDDDSLVQDDEWSLLTDSSTEPTAPTLEEMPHQNVVDIVVKKGDSLDKIARANGTTVQSIKNLNALKNDKLKIGQQLKVDVGSSKKIASAEPVSPPPVALSNGTAMYYTLKSGDSPWKIAKQFHVNMDDLLRLNDLDEEKARNLKIGDKIRVR